MRSKRGFPTGLFLTSVCVIAAVVCAGGCLLAALWSGFAWPAYAAFLLCASLGGGLIVALAGSRTYGELSRLYEAAGRKNGQKSCANATV